MVDFTVGWNVWNCLTTQPLKQIHCSAVLIRPSVSFHQCLCGRLSLACKFLWIHALGWLPVWAGVKTGGKTQGQRQAEETDLSHILIIISQVYQVWKENLCGVKIRLKTNGSRRLNSLLIKPSSLIRDGPNQLLWLLYTVRVECCVVIALNAAAGKTITSGSSWCWASFQSKGNRSMIC